MGIKRNQRDLIENALLRLEITGVTISNVHGYEDLVRIREYKGYDVRVPIILATKISQGAKTMEDFWNPLREASQ
jgi:hypothetical protein